MESPVVPKIQWDFGGKTALSCLWKAKMGFVPANLFFVLSGLLVAVHFDVALSRFTGLMHCMQMMPMRYVRMMRRHFMFASTMMLGRLAMMLRRVFMVFSGFRVMFFKFFWHSIQFPKFSALSTRKAFSDA